MTDQDHPARFLFISTTSSSWGIFDLIFWLADKAQWNTPYDSLITTQEPGGWEYLGSSIEPTH